MIDPNTVTPNTPNARFFILGAKNMIELVYGMAKHVHPMAQLKYIGANLGDYSQFTDQDKLQDYTVIAIFDMMPVPIADMGDIQVIMTNNDSLDKDSGDMNTVLSA